MLGPLRKFSASIYAKILLVVIIIPFIFWGMGGSLSGGNKNIVLTIDDDKYSIQEFSNFISINADGKVNDSQIDRMLSEFIGEKLIEKEIDSFKISLSDTSLANLIKHQKEFKRNDVFSRAEYEKFLIKNNITANNFELILSKGEKKKQLFDLIGGGVFPSKFLVNKSYDKINQERRIELINLNHIFKKKINFSEKEITTYFDNNKKKFTDIIKTIKILELTPQKLTGQSNFNDLFFAKIDEIDELLINGESLNNVIIKFNLDDANTYELNRFGKDINSKDTSSLTKDIIKKIFNTDEQDTSFLIESENKYLALEIIKTDKILKNINNQDTKDNVILDLKLITKKLFISDLISKINKKTFAKSDFDSLAKKEGVNIQKINLKNINDNQILKEQLVSEIYSHPEKNIIVINDIGLTKNYLIYIESVKNVKITNKSTDYEKYFMLSKTEMVNNLFNSYDNYLRNKYIIDVNYQALDTVKNYFN